MPVSRTRKRATTGRGGGPSAILAGTAVARGTGAGTRSTARAGKALLPPPHAETSPAPPAARPRPRRQPPTRGAVRRPLAAPRRRAAVDERPQLLAAAAPAGADDCPVGARRRERRPFAPREQFHVCALPRDHAGEQRAIPFVPPDPRAEDVLPD